MLQAASRPCRPFSAATEGLLFFSLQPDYDIDAEREIVDAAVEGAEAAIHLLQDTVLSPPSPPEPSADAGPPPAAGDRREQVTTSCGGGVVVTFSAPSRGQPDSREATASTPPVAKPGAGTLMDVSAPVSTRVRSRTAGCASERERFSQGLRPP